MVNAMINISDHTNRILNIIKAKFDLRTKSEAIDIMAKDYEECVLEPQLRPDFISRMKDIEKEPLIEVKDFRERYGVQAKA